ncbi:SET and MYND domain-containing protein 4 [Eurytemora carolleeae]|uniref:SET and MYND domain-containing protein 4 n=1 Tax=Eurytemora carolleeae TaxID=1294199 RepID=UPI000C78165D|nr:SET and MYND domain-containing protein 4 [Eurytemora carolleeae]|eukprot:XP_023335424.1 SET and MYND domain-containing protein 4-like [Eurytemora affinis]
MRDAGNSAFSLQNDEEALECYNQALLVAPADPWDGQGEDMALALANRSALFFRQGNSQQCLKDTQLALKSGYPVHLQYKLLQRHAKCLCELGMFTEAKSFFSEALSSLGKSKLGKVQL